MNEGKHSNHNNHLHDYNPANSPVRRASSTSQYNFCTSCHDEHLRRLNDEEQRKLQEIEAIKREKETLLRAACAAGKNSN